MNMSDTDQQLLARYARHHAEDAFTEIVRRHLDLVHSAALRQVRSPELAEEVAQAAFLDLARQAHRLPPDTVVPAWLYQVSRRTAIDVVRRETSRQLREQVAQELHAMNATAADWTHIQPLLDEAMHALDDTDRAAVLLRYFENKSLREVGQTLGTSENAAQKRLGRAVERMREFFAKRGVSVGASGLVVALSANAVQAAPVGLAFTISSAAALVGAAVHSSTVITSAKLIAMTTLQKTIVTATLVAVIGTGIYKARQTTHRQLVVRTRDQTPLPASSPTPEAAADKPPAPPRRPITLQPTVAPKPVSALKAKSAAVSFPSTQIYELMKQKQPRLTLAQVEPYLKANGRSAASLLAAFRTTTDPRLLAEAIQTFPNDPQVSFEAAIQKDASPEDRRRNLEAFKQADPENSLANYLSALEHFKTGETDATVKDLVAAAGKAQFLDYGRDRKQTDEEAYLAAGYPPGEAKMMGNMFLIEPHLVQFRELGQSLIAMADSYRRSGDEDSRQNAVQMAVDLGRRFGDPAPEVPLVNQLVGISIERATLAVLDPANPYGTTGQTVQERLDQLVQRKEAIHVISARADPLWEKLTDQDWISYHDQVAAIGEEAALRWMVSHAGHQ